MVSFAVSGCGLLGNCWFQDDVLKLRRGVEHKAELEWAFMLKFDSNDEKLGTLVTMSEQPLKINKNWSFQFSLVLQKNIQ